LLHDLDVLKNTQDTLAIVICVNWANGLGLIRSLGKMHIPVLALDPEPDSLGFVSKYTTYSMVCPDPGEDPEQFLAFMTELGQQLSRKGVLFLTRDQDITTISQNRHKLEPYFHIPFAGWDVVRQIVDKRGQCRVAQEIGIPMPVTHFPTDVAEVEQLADQLPYPVIIKPTYHVEFGERFKSKGFVAHTPAEALAQYQRAAEYDLMIQEIIPGDASYLYTLGSYISRDGAPLGIFTGRKLRQVPREFGISRASESIAAPQVIDQGLRLLHALGFWGISQVEFKLDPRDGLYKLIEINARSYSWQYLATACGVNLAYLAYQDALGQSVPSVTSHTYDKRWLLLPVDFVLTPLEILRGQYALGAWLKTLRHVSAAGIFSWDDPKPMLPYLWQRIRSGGLWRRIRGAASQ
jgi:predicted ATP-grasp superfamily ATP-dependent carboligase